MLIPNKLMILIARRKEAFSRTHVAGTRRFFIMFSMLITGSKKL